MRGSECGPSPFRNPTLPTPRSRLGENLTELMTQALAGREPNKKQAIVYDHEQLRTIVLSQKQRVLVDVWVNTHNYALCTRAINEKFHTKHTAVTVKRWLDYQSVRDYCYKLEMDKAIYNGSTQEEWLARGIQVEYGRVKVTDQQLAAWKERGKAMGYYKDESKLQTNVQINFTQGDGAQ